MSAWNCIRKGISETAPLPIILFSCKRPSVFITLTLSFTRNAIASTAARTISSLFDLFLSPYIHTVLLLSQCGDPRLLTDGSIKMRFIDPLQSFSTSSFGQMRPRLSFSQDKNEPAELIIPSRRYEVFSLFDHAMVV